MERQPPLSQTERLRLPFFSHFEIDIISALTEQLVNALSLLDKGALTTENIQSVPNERGVYQLFHNENLVYVGKADILRSRLTDHYWKIRGRKNISAEEMTFRCVTVHRNWTALAPERTLIDHFKGEGLCEWNGNAFGPHDPGRERETTNKPTEGFDTQFPIREDWICEGIQSGDWQIAPLLKALKQQLPFLLRFGKLRDSKPDYSDAHVQVPASGMTAEALLRLVTQHMDGWQATRFPGHMILYHERRTYAHGINVWPTA